MPASAPCLLERLQNSAVSTTGPNAAPKPAHAKDTIPKTELFGSLAMKAAITEIAKTETLAACIAAFSEIFTRKKPPKRLWEILEDADRS